MNELNISDVYSEIYDRATKNNSLINVNIELLTKCNWRCKYCYIPNHDDDGMDKETVFKLFKELREMGVFEIILTGGEIFCRKDVMEIISKARGMFFNLYLYTNVSLLTEEIIIRLSKMYISQISCTIFSLDHDIHDFITSTPGSLDKALKNIMLIKKYNIPLEIKVPILRMNINSYKKVEEFCKEHGFDYKANFEVFPKSDGDRSPEEFALSPEQLDKVIVDIDKLRGFKLTNHSKDEYVCPNLKSTLSIDCKGNVYPCNKFFFKVGNIYDNSIREIWNNSADLNKIKEVKWGDLKECYKCENNKFCIRCPGVALLENNDILAKSDFACKVSNVRCKKYKL